VAKRKSTFCCFLEIFGGIWLAVTLFLWPSCGEMRGKRGRLTPFSRALIWLEEIDPGTHDRIKRGGGSDVCTAAAARSRRLERRQRIQRGLGFVVQHLGFGRLFAKAIDDVRRGLRHKRLVAKLLLRRRQTLLILRQVLG
jgi:hypothetical protein